MDDDDFDGDEHAEPDVEWLVQDMGGRLWFADGDTADDTVPVQAWAPALDAVEDALTRDPPRSLVVVGEPGTGKTALIREATRRLHAQGATVFEASSTDVTAGQSYVGQLEGRVQQLARSSAGKPVVWVLPDPDASVGAGSYRGNPQGLLDRMLPYVARGDLQMIVEASPTTWAKVTQLRPLAGRVFEPVRLDPLGEEDALALARSWAAARSLPVDEATLREALTLADEHLATTASPGRLLRVVRATHERRQRQDERPDAVGSDDVLATVAELSGLPLDLLDPRRRLDLEAVRGFLAARVMGQPDAVSVLVERIAMLKAGLTDPSRPTGVFLFVGPTGTGKTELAKALAEYLFGSAERLVRLDMSEFQTADSLERLLAGPQADEEAPLIPAVRRQPFSVVLLDEFEKAHHNIWDVFLQLFDDGRLTDRAGATADFRHTVVIMTSNLGVADGSRGALGFAAGAGGAPATAIDRSVADAFRPEFVNRIDRVVAFRRLTRDVMRLLVRKELSDVETRRGLRTRPWSVEWDETAVEVLLERGFTSDLGARPLKRAVDTLVLAPLARAIVEHEVPEGEQFLLVRGEGAEVRVEFIDPRGGAQPPPEPEPLIAEETPGPGGVRAVALDPTGERAEAASLAAALEAVDGRMREGGWAVRKEAALERMAEPGFWEREDRHAVLGLAEQLDRLEAGTAGARRLLGRLRSGAARAERGSARLAGLLALRLHLLDAALDGLEENEPGDALVRVAPVEGDPAFAARVTAMYRGWAERRGMQLEDLGEGVLAISGFGAWRILCAEQGLHVLETPRRSPGFDRAVVRVLVAPQPDEPREAESAARREQVERALVAAPIRAAVVRRYREAPSPLVRDATGWRTGRADRVLGGDFDLFGA